MNKEKKQGSSWFGLFEPMVDFYALLNHQASKTLEGVEALAVWLKEGGEERCQKVRVLEKEADVLKIDLQKKLFECFVTPFDREDIFELCVALDEIINAAKGVVREIEAFDVSPEGTALREMGDLLVEGTQALRLSILALRKNLREASEQALLARKVENRFTKVYRSAMRDLLTLDDFKVVMRTKEVYKTMLVGAERIDIMGEKILQVIIKMN